MYPSANQIVCNKKRRKDPSDFAIWWCPPSNLFTSNKMSSSTRRTGCVRHSQDFPPRTQYMYKKHFHDAKSWPLCCISPAPASSAIAPLHREWLKKNPRSPELLKFKKSEMVVTHIQILVYYSTFIQTKASQSKSFRDQLCNMEAVKKPFAL